MANIPANYRQIERSGLRPAYGSRLAGPAEPSEALVLAVSVRQRPDAPPLPDHAYWMATPPGKRKFLSSQEFEAEHGAAQADLDAVAQFARAQGLTVVDTRVAGRTAVLSGRSSRLAGRSPLTCRATSHPMARIGAMRALSTSPLICLRSSPQYSGSTTGGPVAATA